MAKTQGLLIIAAAILAIIFVPHRVGNLGLRLVVKLATGFNMLFVVNETDVSPQYRALAGVMLASRVEANRTVPDEISFMRLFADHGIRVLAPLDPNLAVSYHAAAEEGAPPVQVIRLNTSHNASAPVILHFHPGGYVFGTAASFVGTVAVFGTRGGADVASVEYRLVPENSLADVMQDAVNAYRWLLRQKRPQQIVLMGESAGGGLALLLLRQIKKLGLPMPAGAVLGSPYVDLTRDSLSPDTGKDFFLQQQLVSLLAPMHKATAREYSPLFMPATDFAGLPPIYSISGGIEMLLPGIEQMCAKLREAGVNATCVTVPHMPHIFHVLHDWFPEAETAANDAVKFIRWATEQ